LVLAALGCVSQRRVSIEHRITRKPNIIVVPLNFHPCARPKSTSASNQAMQLTASRPVDCASRVCRRRLMLRSMHRGLAAADLVSC
jgi:hypothetical protein